MKRSLRTLLFASLVLASAPVLADAPVGHYEPFVRDTPTIRDSFTLLEWDRFAPRTKKLFGSANASCGAPFNGRLPTVKELLTLVDEQPHKEYEFGATVEKAIDGTGGGAFGSYTSVDAPYWTSTPTDVAGERWGVSFKDGTMVRLKENDTTGFYVRCVK